MSGISLYEQQLLNDRKQADKTNISTSTTTKALTIHDAPTTSVAPVKPVVKSVAKATKPSNDAVYIRDIPKALMTVVRSEFPDAQNHTDALCAYIIAHSDIKMNVSDVVSDLVRNRHGDQSLETIEQRLNKMERQLSATGIMLQEIELGVGYVIFDYMGYRITNAPKNPRDVDLLEHGVKDIVERLREQSKQLRTQDSLSNGRPLR